MMTPEEKAKELIDKVTFASIYFKDGAKEARKLGKASAIICVNEIIKEFKSQLTDIVVEHYKIDYWQSVKSHLLKM